MPAAPGGVREYAALRREREQPHGRGREDARGVDALEADGRDELVAAGALGGGFWLYTPRNGAQRQPTGLNAQWPCSCSRICARARAIEAR